MSILFKLKEWLTIAETARYLSIAMSEEVSEADVLRLALDGHLPLSVYLTQQVYGRMNFAISIQAACDLSWEVEDYTGVNLIEPGVVLIQDDHFLIGVVGVVDLAMGRADDIVSRIVEEEYLRLMGGAKKDDAIRGGIFVLGDESTPLEEPFPEARTYARRDGRPILRLVELSDPRSEATPLLKNLPNGSFFVVRAKGIARLMQSMVGEPTPTDKPLLTTERNTLLTIIAALCDYSAIKHQDRGVPQRIMEMTDEIGAHLDDGTIRTALKQIPGALSPRTK